MWKKFDLKTWTYAGNKLNNPIIIIWKLLWIVPLKFFLAITCLCALLGFGWYSASQIWKEVN